MSGGLAGASCKFIYHVDEQEHLKFFNNYLKVLHRYRVYEGKDGEDQCAASAIWAQKSHRYIKNIFCL